MSEDDTGREKPSNGRRGRQASKVRASSAIARTKAPQRPRVASRATRKTAAEQDETLPPVDATGQPAEDTGSPAGDAAAPTKAQPVASGPDSEGVPVEEKSAGSSIPVGQAPEKKPTKRRSPARKTIASKTSAASEAQVKPNERNKATSATRQGATHRRAVVPRTGRNAGGPSTSTADLARPVAPTEGSGSPPIDPMAELAGLAERSLHESLQSLRSVTESRSLSELLERQSQHMRLMTEIWVRQTQRSMEVFNAMLIQRRR